MFASVNPKRVGINHDKGHNGGYFTLQGFGRSKAQGARGRGFDRRSPFRFTRHIHAWVEEGGGGLWKDEEWKIFVQILGGA